MVRIHAPQLIYLLLVGISLGVDIAKHGTPRTGKHDAWSGLIAMVAMLALLYWGGFF